MPKIYITCDLCKSGFFRDRFRVKRNARCGYANLCSSTCHGKWMNLSPVKQRLLQEAAARLNANQKGPNNRNWKGGVSKQAAAARKLAAATRELAKPPQKEASNATYDKVDLRRLPHFCTDS